MTIARCIFIGAICATARRSTICTSATTLSSKLLEDRVSGRARLRVTPKKK